MIVYTAGIRPSLIDAIDQVLNDKSNLEMGRYRYWKRRYDTDNRRYYRRCRYYQPISSPVIVNRCCSLPVPLQSVLLWELTALCVCQVDWHSIYVSHTSYKRLSCMQSTSLKGLENRGFSWKKTEPKSTENEKSETVTTLWVYMSVTHHKRLSSQQVWRWSCTSTRRFFCDNFQESTQDSFIYPCRVSLLGRVKAGMCDAAWCAPCTWAPLV